MIVVQWLQPRDDCANNVKAKIGDIGSGDLHRVSVKARAGEGRSSGRPSRGRCFTEGDLGPLVRKEAKLVAQGRGSRVTEHVITQGSELVGGAGVIVGSLVAAVEEDACQRRFFQSQ